VQKRSYCAKVPIKSKVSCAKERALFDVQKSHHSSCKGGFCEEMRSSKARSLVQKSHHLFVQRGPHCSCKGALTLRAKEPSLVVQRRDLCKGGSLVLLCRARSVVPRSPHSSCKGGSVVQRSPTIARSPVQRMVLCAQEPSLFVQRSPRSCAKEGLLCKGAHQRSASKEPVKRKFSCAKEGRVCTGALKK